MKGDWPVCGLTGERTAISTFRAARVMAPSPEAEAVVREFREETGLRVAADVRLTEAAQFVDKSDGRTVNNTGGFWTLRLLDPTPAGKIEDDHELVWLDPAEALASLRHEAHAWAVAVWLRSRKPT